MTYDQSLDFEIAINAVCILAFIVGVITARASIARWPFARGWFVLQIGGTVIGLIVVTATGDAAIPIGLVFAALLTWATGWISGAFANWLGRSKWWVLLGIFMAFLNPKSEAVDGLVIPAE